MSNIKAHDKGQRSISINGSAAVTPGDGISTNQLEGDGTITWDVSVAAGPAVGATPVNLEGCNGDPSVAANWFQLDTVDLAGLSNVLRHVATKPVMWLRLNPTANPSAKVLTGGFYIR